MQAQMLTSKFGGELISFKLNGEEKIHQGKDCVDENGKIYWQRHSPILFPVVGKLKKNQTIIGGRTYEMPQHGFARDLEFEPLTKLDNFHSYMLKSNKYTLSRYPYDFELYATYRIDGNKLTTIYKVINTGITNMPFGIGGHPAFKIDLEQLKKGNYYIEFEEDEEKLPFAKAEVVRLMKENLDDDKMIRERVKVEMNKFLGEVLKNVCKQLNDYPYTTIEYEMLKESTYPYTNITRINQEKERILLHLEAIKADCNALAMDVQRTLKLKDVAEEDDLSSFLAHDDEETEEEE